MSFRVKNSGRRRVMVVLQVPEESPCDSVLLQKRDHDAVQLHLQRDELHRLQHPLSEPLASVRLLEISWQENVTKAQDQASLGD